MAESRKRVYTFLQMPHHVQVERAKSAGVFHKGDESRHSSDALQCWVKRAKADGTLDILLPIVKEPEQVGEQKTRRYKLLSDNDGHHYLVPAENEDAFNKWVDSFNEDEEGDPDGYEKLGAESLGCSPTCVSFIDPKVD